MHQNEKIRIDWNDIDRLALALEERIRASGRSFNAVYGVPRGGLILAVLLSHRLGLKVLLDAARIGEDTLVVDDLSDSGETLQNISAATGAISTAVLYHGADSAFTPTFFAAAKPDGWLVFPWETAESSQYDSTVRATPL